MQLVKPPTRFCYIQLLPTVSLVIDGVLHHNTPLVTDTSVTRFASKS